MSTCVAPAGSPCRTSRGRVAYHYHTARFRLVPHLAKVLHVPVPPLRHPGGVWVELPPPAVDSLVRSERFKIGYARVSTARQSLDSQIDALTEAGVDKIFSEKISTRVSTRPELEKAISLAGEKRAEGAAVTMVVHEHKRLGRGIEMAMMAEQLKAADVELEFLTGELKGSHDPSGFLFVIMAAMSGMEREYIRDKMLDGQESARARGKTIGGVFVMDEEMKAEAVRMRDEGLSLRQIAKRLVIPSGAKKGQHPSAPTVMRVLRDYDEVSV